MHEKYTIEELQEYAHSLGGECLSTEYKNALTKYEWKCKRGHIWKTTWSSVYNNKTWCKWCANMKYSLEYLQKLGEKYNCKCLSQEYISCNEVYRWKCNNCGDITISSTINIKLRGYICKGITCGRIKKLYDPKK